MAIQTSPAPEQANSAASGLSAPNAAAQAAAPKRPRDIRLDFYRGLAMIVILFAHITDNPWTLWLPGRFGFSDSTEIFVFCSGMASALAYGVIFHRAGWLIGTARILYRMWQVYWVHIGVFLATLFFMLALNYSGYAVKDEVGALNLHPFLRNTGPNFFGLMTLTYVPNYFDILPMYVAILAMVPVMVAIGRIDGRLAVLASVALWVWGTSGGLQIPAEWWFTNGSTRAWFFNPFAWQLVFFTGFAFIAGWIPKPPLRRDLIALAGVAVIITVPFAWYKTIGRFEPLQDWRRDWWFLYDKSRFGLLRYVHFLSLAYLAWAFAGPAGARLKRLAQEFPRAIGAVVQIGQQSLAVFAVSMVLARILGAVLYMIGPGWVVTPLINLTGLFLIWATAVAAAWFKGAGWKSKIGTAAAAPTTGTAPVETGIDAAGIAPPQGVKA